MSYFSYLASNKSYSKIFPAITVFLGYSQKLPVLNNKWHGLILTRWLFATHTICDKNLEILSHRIRPPPFFNVVAASQTVKCHLNTVQGKGVFQGFLARIVGP